MYERPTLERLGSFRELTQLGFTGQSDGASIFGLGSAGRRGGRRGRDRFPDRDLPTTS